MGLGKPREERKDLYDILIGTSQKGGGSFGPTREDREIEKERLDLGGG